MSLLSLRNISFSYGDKQILKNFSLEAEEGSFTTLLGASGSGKTTLLRLISGFLDMQEGEVYINGKLMNGVLPNKRRIGMVFQDYALFPHMTVKQNLYYGLKLLKQSKEEKKLNEQTVNETAENLGLTSLMERYPWELSGGQQQRVALGRVLVLKPELLLMDEPLSSLDKNLRLKLREELKEIQKKLKITTIYVTHDQEEAFSLSDKIAVMNEGSLLQYGSPYDIYFNPQNRFTAEFSGSVNYIGEKVVRPEWIYVITETDGDVSSADLRGRVIKKDFSGSFTRLEILSEGKVIKADLNSFEAQKIGDGDEVFMFIRHSTVLKSE